MNYEDIFKKLKLDRENGLFYFNEKKWTGKDVFSYETKKIIEYKIQPYAFFVFNKEPLILFFKNINKLDFRNIWNFNKPAIIFDITESTLNIYNGFNFLKENEKLDILSNSENLTDFEFFNLVTGKTWIKYQNKLKKQNRVDEKLLENIKFLNNILKTKYGLSDLSANKLIGRIIFTRYLIDRNVGIRFNGYNVIDNLTFENILKSQKETFDFFDYLKTQFNGNLFPITEEERKKVDVHVLNEIIKLLNETDFKDGQNSFFKFYDFSIIPVELISNVYEFFIGQEGQEEKGAYYTPTFLVEYILNDTVKEYFIENQEEINCKVLDPACGSGIFLVQTLRKIIEQYQKNNPDFNKNQVKYKKSIKELLKQNIFGIDNDESAVSVAIFSLYLTLLDYLTPPEIVDFKFPELLNTNLFKADFFDTKSEYNEIFKQLHFNFILGNPPWGEVKDSVKLYESYWKEREKRENKEIKVSDKQIAEVFLIRVSDFSFCETAFVVTSKILYKVGRKNEYPKIFRNYLANNFKIRKVFELSSVREYIFDKSNDPAQASAVVLFYSHQPSIEKNKSNIVTHISIKPNRFFKIFKTFIIEKQDIKELRQEYFMDKENDWIWKTLVYGNMLDFYFVKRLKKQFLTINEKLIKDDNFFVKQGLKRKDGKIKKSSKEIRGRLFLDADNLEQFQIFPSNVIWEYDEVGYFPGIVTFDPKTLVIKQGVDDNFRGVSAMKYDDAVFTSSITAIKSKTNDLDILKSMNALFNSSLFSYFMVQTNSSVGIDRFRSFDKEKFAFPCDSNRKLPELVTEIEEIARKQIESDGLPKNEIQELKKQFDKKQNEIDQEVINIFELDQEEKELLDYTYNISISLIKNRNFDLIFRELAFENVHLENYARIFINSFNRTYNSEDNYFEVEIWWSKHLIGMKFKVIPERSEKENQILWKKGIEINEILQKVGELQFSEVTEQIFIQKDIRGFEEDYFYIIKPNEYKLWHKAIAYNDLREIDYEIMKAAKEDIENECK